MKRFQMPCTLATSLLAAAIVAAAFLGDVDLIQWNTKLLERIEVHEVDDIVAACLAIFFGVLADYLIAIRSNRRQADIQAQRLHVLRATMRTVQDIVNNALNGMQILRLDGDGVLPKESLDLFDTTIAETASKLKALGDLQGTPERQMASGVGIDFEAGSRSDRRPPGPTARSA